MQLKTALVIDPSTDIRERLAQILLAPEWTIREANNNTAALELAQSTIFDLIITDQTSAAKEDVRFLQSIRDLHPETRVIILTDEGTPQDVLDAIREGAFSYFSRPFSLESLSEAVRSAMNAPSWHDGIEVVSGTPHWVRLIARCDLETADRLMRFVHEMIDLPEEEKHTVAAALQELLMNAMEYGGKFDPQHYVELSYIRTKRAVACRVKDPGEGFSLDEIHHAAVSNPPGDPLRHLNYREAGRLRPGGFGILLSRNMVDELFYNDKGNEVVMIKYVDQPASKQAK
ncbi:MAG TPA: ATP-binding protein [Bryobacteraceae bacterium]|nr:ATP-binding protein [Bryobacteraceae bacterium]